MVLQSEPKCNDEAHAMQVPTPLSPYAASRTNLAHAVRCPVLTSATLCSVQYELWKRAGILQYDCTYSGNAVQDGCDIFYTLWAVGSGALELPDIAGLPMGKGPNALTAHNIVMEVRAFV